MQSVSVGLEAEEIEHYRGLSVPLSRYGSDGLARGVTEDGARTCEMEYIEDGGLVLI